MRSGIGKSHIQPMGSPHVVNSLFSLYTIYLDHASTNQEKHEDFTYQTLESLLAYVFFAQPAGLAQTLR